MHPESPSEEVPSGPLPVTRGKSVGICSRLLWVGFIGLPVLAVLLRADDWLRAQRTLMAGKDWSGLALVLSGSANGFFLIPVMVTWAAWLHWIARYRAARIVVIMIFSGLLAGASGTVLRSVIGRTRPEVSVEQGWFGPRKDGLWLIGRHAYGSFPSGHASIASGLGLMAFAWSRRAGRIGTAYALAVAWSRFHLGAHRASDVWAGLMVGSLTAVILLPRVEDWVHRGGAPRWVSRRLSIEWLK